MRLLFIGGSGTLGTQMRHFPNGVTGMMIDCPGRDELDICLSSSIYRYLQNTQYDIIVLLAGEKDQGAIEKNSSNATQTNIIGVANVVRAMQQTKCEARLVYISTGYVYKGNGPYHKETDGILPCNKYAWSKLGGECSIRMLDENQYLIVRCEFSKAPWHKDYAFTDQYTSREEIEIIADKIWDLIMGGAAGTYNVGGKRKSVYQYARSLDNGNKKVLRCKMKDFATVPLPYDSSLNTDKYDRFMGGRNGEIT